MNLTVVQQFYKTPGNVHVSTDDGNLEAEKRM